jgi:hypothetical protein
VDEQCPAAGRRGGSEFHPTGSLEVSDDAGHGSGREAGGTRELRLCCRTVAGKGRGHAFDVLTAQGGLGTRSDGSN